MNTLGTGTTQFNSILGTSGGVGGQTGTAILGDLEDSFVFNVNDTDFKGNLNIISGTLSIRDNTTSDLTFTNKSGGTQYGSLSFTSTDGTLNYNGTRFQIKDAKNHTILVSDNSGNIAINQDTTNPSYNFDVSGDGNFSGGLHVDNDLSVSGEFLLEGNSFDTVVKNSNTGQFVQYYFNQPPSLVDNYVNTTYNEGALNLHWKKGSAYDLSFILSTTGETLPHIDTVVIDLSSESVNSWVRFAELSFNDTSTIFYYGDSSGGITIDETENFTVRVYATNKSDSSFNYLYYRDVSLQDSGNFPANTPLIEYNDSTIDVSNIRTVSINGIPSITLFDVFDISFTVSSISPNYLLNGREKNEFADLTLDSQMGYQREITEDLCGGSNVIQFSFNSGTSATVSDLDLSDICPSASIYTNSKLNVFALEAFNIKGTTTLDLSFSRINGDGGTAWWLDASSLVVDGSGCYSANTIQSFGRDTFDIRITNTLIDGVDVSTVITDIFDNSRNEHDALTQDGQMLFIEGQYCGVGYTSSVVGGSVYRDWTDVCGADYSALSSTGITDVIRDRGYDNTSPLYKWFIRTFSLTTNETGRFRTLNINGHTTNTEWKQRGYRVYIMQFLYESDSDVNSAYWDRTSWMDATRVLSSKIAQSPYPRTAIDGYGCYYGDGDVALKLNIRGNSRSDVYIMIGIENGAGVGGDTRDTFIESVDLT